MKNFYLVAGSTRRSLVSTKFILLLLLLSPSTIFAADLVKGRALYQTHCAGCHGENGTSLNPEVPNFARGERLFQPDPDLIDMVRSGVNAMPPFIGILDDREILNVISYARTLQW